MSLGPSEATGQQHQEQRLTPDSSTSPDSLRAASRESTYSTAPARSWSSSSLQSGLLAPTAKEQHKRP